MKKTLIIYDSLIKIVKDGTLMEDYVFELYEKDSNGNIVHKNIRVYDLWLTMDIFHGHSPYHLIKMVYLTSIFASQNDLSP